MARLIFRPTSWLGALARFHTTPRSSRFAISAAPDLAELLVDFIALAFVESSRFEAVFVDGGATMTEGERMKSRTARSPD